jgi:class 3 adenylate cyclase
VNLKGGGFHQAHKEHRVGNWNYNRAKAQIEARLNQVKIVEICDYTRETSLKSIPSNKAYRMHAVHLYVDILNLAEMLNSTDVEGETCHKRTLRFLNLHYRAAHRVLAECGVIRVDFHNQRLHAVIAKPYGEEDESTRVHKAVAIGQLLIDVLAETGDYDEHIADAKVRIGIDTGRALAVNNGRHGNREPLFLGKPANVAAKLASNGSKVGIYLSDEAREAIGLPALGGDKPLSTPLTTEQIEGSQEDASLLVSASDVIEEWHEDNEQNPIGAFEFARPTPPLSTLDITKLTPGNSRRTEAVSIYADLDGFTAYVDAHIDDNSEDVVRCLHVLRSEMDRVIMSDFEGRRIRFIGDCVHGLLVEGTAQTTDVEKTISSAVICAGGLRSSFELALEVLTDDGVEVGDLGLAIGLEFGPMVVSRLGMQGDRVRCAVSRGVLASEDEQKGCDGTETAIGATAYASGSEAVRQVFGNRRQCVGLTYDVALEALTAERDRTAKAAASAAYAVSSPALARAIERPLQPHASAK